MKSLDQLSALMMIQKNVLQMHDDLTASALVKVIDQGNVVRVITPTIKLPFSNFVLQTRVERVDLDEVIPAIIAEYHSTQTSFIWTVSPFCIPDDIDDKILAHGGVLYKPYYFGIRALTQADIYPVVLHNARLEYVDSIEQLEQWVMPQVAVNKIDERSSEQLLKLFQGVLSNSDRFHFLTIFQHEQPVASALLYIEDKVAGIYSACTIPAARQQGFNHYLECYRFALAREYGCEHMVVEASEMSRHIAEKNGFQFLDVCNDYLFQYKGER